MNEIMEKQTENQELESIITSQFDNLVEFTNAIEIYFSKKNEERQKIINNVLLKYGNDEDDDSISKGTITWIPIVPKIIEQMVSQRKGEKKHNKGNNFTQYFIYAIILQYTLNNEMCDLNDNQFAVILHVRDTDAIKNYIKELVKDNFIRFFSGQGNCKEILLEKIIDLLENLKTVKKKRNRKNYIQEDKIIEEIDLIIDDYQGETSSYLKNDRILIADLDNIQNFSMIKLPIIPEIQTKINTYDYLIFTFILMKTYPNKKLKITNHEISALLGCSLRIVESFCKNYKDKYFKADYSDNKKKYNRTSIYVDKEIMDKILLNNFKNISELV